MTTFNITHSSSFILLFIIFYDRNCPVWIVPIDQRKFFLSTIISFLQVCSKYRQVKCRFCNETKKKQKRKFEVFYFSYPDARTMPKAKVKMFGVEKGWIRHGQATTHNSSKANKNFWSFLCHNMLVRSNTSFYPPSKVSATEKDFNEIILLCSFCMM